ncbi:hypothetical protein [Serratia sp. JSRIV004]|uniref:hypothetical protein n=1 Tax=Serratia sp. JSRIV004 TaxID=2831895 RepID=UPI001CBBB631|nr:hypothetical protein [Serratia sp. JSRIV004]UAN60618.1 hypothetical protein KGP21_29460 [Serratia sp. JSRIV004]
MSAKSEFMKELEINSNISMEKERLIQENLTLFKTSIEELSNNIRSWLNGTNIKIETSDTLLMDIIDFDNKMQSIHLRYMDSIANFKPISLYNTKEKDKKCFIQIDISNPKKDQKVKKFNISLINGNGYEFYFNPENKEDSTPFDENKFFELMLHFA